jgi:hypothetical protein
VRPHGQKIPLLRSNRDEPQGRELLDRTRSVAKELVFAKVSRALKFKWVSSRKTLSEKDC